MASHRTNSVESWIIGYGNPARRDDGVGHYMVEGLRERLKGMRHIRFRTGHQLEPALLDELGSADQVILVDATLNVLKEGWECVRVHPEFDMPPYLTHHLKPSYFLAILESIYHRSPRTWLTSVQGDDFGYGEGLTPEAEARAAKAIPAIVRLMAEDKTTQHVTLKT